jgi:hypothetical protein
LYGTQLNGLSQANGYGDDNQQATNYPLVRATHSATGHVSFWRTSGHSTMAIGTGSQVVSTHFTVPTNVPQGAYMVSVIANGISSTPVGVDVDTGFGQASYLLVDHSFGASSRIWAYAEGNWHGKDIASSDIGGISEDLFAANRVDCWWSGDELTLVRGWKND